MRRRRALIDEYLRAHDPAPQPATADDPRSFAVAGAGPAPAPVRDGRNRARRIGLPALTFFTTVAAIAVVAFMPGRASRSTDRFLSPEAAVAAAARNLEEEGILHWKFTTSVRPGPDGGAVAPNVYGFEEWRDLKTNASYRINPPAGGLASMALRSWYNGKRTTIDLHGVLKGSTDPRPVVVRTVRRRGEPIPAGKERTPLDSVRRLLRSAARGKARVSPAPNEHGAPVVRVDRTKTQKVGTVVLSTWITRERTPRLLRSTSDFTPSAYGRGRGATESQTVREFTIWELLPRTPSNIAMVEPPEFDPAKYRVTTQFLGPRKR